MRPRAPADGPAHGQQGNLVPRRRCNPQEPQPDHYLQLGADVDGEDKDDNSGWSVSLSADGARMAVGAAKNDGGSRNAGHVRVLSRVPPEPSVAPRPAGL